MQSERSRRETDERGALEGEREGEEECERRK